MSDPYSKSEVKFKNLEPRKKAAKCYCCHKIVYVAANCNINPQCVSCSEEYFSKDCPLQDTPELPIPTLKCVKCGLSHPSNYKACLKFLTKPEFIKS